MRETDHRNALDWQQDQPPDASAALAALRLAGAAQFDPVSFCYMEVLARRAATHRAPVKRLLEHKLAHTLVAFRERFEHAQNDARDTINTITPQYPHAANDLQRLFSAGDFRGVGTFIAKLKKGTPHASLGNLVVYRAQHAPKPVDTGVDGRFNADTGARPELKATQYFRNTWSKLSVDKRVAQALAQAPKNAGPINSHRLVLRSLALMRDLSPDYLNRFTSYVDTLLSLDPGDPHKQADAQTAAGGNSSKKSKSRRAKIRQKSDKNSPAS